MKLFGKQLPLSGNDGERRERGRPQGSRPRARSQFNLRSRLVLVCGTLGLCSVALLARALDLQVIDHAFYQQQGDARFVREIPIATSRGMITDRNGEPLAISSPVESIWGNPKELLKVPARLPALARALGMPQDELVSRLSQRAGKEFVYLKRRINPDEASRILALGVPGVASQREYRRFYPQGEAVAHVLGFTNIDDRGQEGLELAFDEWLAGKPGLKRVIQNRRGEVVENVELVREPNPGRDLRLTIDRRIQYLAYRELKAAIGEHQAASGSVVVVDVANGEILAMVNWPSYNPNAGGTGDPALRRNRAVTDVLEPGSVIKAFTVAAGIESGKFNAETLIDTTPGTLPVANHIVRDIHDYGVVNLTRLLTKSSNVGATKIALQLTNDHLYDVFHRFGFGEVSGCGFPGESPGVLPAARGWGTLEKATLSYGYGLSSTPLQLAQAYAALANGGRLRAPTFVAGTQTPDAAVLDPQIAATVLEMLEKVISEGTGKKAAVPNYRVAGKTGTSRKAVPGGYQSRYISVFAGMVPVSHPRLAAAVVINDPRGKVYFGGEVAAPVFGNLMTAALRLMDIAPDNVVLPAPGALPPTLLATVPAAEASPYAEGVAP